MRESESNARHSTNALIQGLATQAGRKRHFSWRFEAVFPVALAVSFLAAIAVVLLTTGVRPDLSNVLSTWTFQFKVIGMILVSAGAFQLVRAAVRPGSTVHALLSLAPGAVFLIGGASLDKTGFPLMGVHALAVPRCAGVIILSSIAPLATILAAMRAGTPTNLTKAGAFAGLLGGSVGALAYTVACLNDGATFVAIWYSVAIGLVAVFGAIVGPKTLRW